MSLNIGKIVAMNAELGAGYLRRARAAKRSAAKQVPDVPACCRAEYWEERVYGAPQVIPCSYCGAPGQRIGMPCEYCQVAVSR